MEKQFESQVYLACALATHPAEYEHVLDMIEHQRPNLSRTTYTHLENYVMNHYIVHLN